MDFLIMIVAAVIVFGKLAAKSEGEGKKKRTQNVGPTAEEWAEARRQQADSLRVHAAGVDSCEGRLESLKVLYDAGILDREEYTQRVARVKSRHTLRQ